MKTSSLAGLVLMSLSWLPAAAQTGETPRQLGTLPSVPPISQPRPPAPAQLGGAPTAKPAPTPAATAPRDSARQASAPAAGYGTMRVPGAEGALTGPMSRQRGYQVGLKTGEVLQAGDVATKNPLFGREHLLLNGQQRVEMENVRFYEDASGRYLRAALPGTSQETSLHLDKTGRVSVYSITTSQYSGGGFGPTGASYGGGFNTVKREYFSKDNGPIQTLTHRNLAAATADSPGAQTLLAQAKRYKLYSALSYIAGGGIILAGLTTARPMEDTQKRRFSPVIFAAIPFLVVPLVLRGRQSNAQEQAISLYNAGK